MLLSSISAALSTLFAAIAALAALGAIVQAGRNHREDAGERLRERTARREQFERESRERRRALEDERRARLLEQIGRISEQVAVVRETARLEAANDGSINSPIGLDVTPREKARFFWNARSQLGASLAAYRALGGNEPLAECVELATGSTMNHLMRVISTATGAFDELARATEVVMPSESDADGLSFDETGYADDSRGLSVGEAPRGGEKSFDASA